MLLNMRLCIYLFFCMLMFAWNVNGARRSKLSKLQHDLKHLKKWVDALCEQDTTSGAVGFCVSELGNNLFNDNPITLIYNNEDFNQGATVDLATGVFTATQAGTYTFWVQICNEDDNGVAVHLLLNDVDLIADGWIAEDIYGTCGTTMGLVTLQVGDTVKVFIPDGGDFEETEFRTNRFCGYRIG